MRRYITVADVEGAWVEPEFNSGLIERCRAYWSTPVTELPNGILAMFIRQKFGLPVVIPEARLRIEQGVHDDSELYDDELSNALSEVQNA
jgi:hypothetical protein